MRCVLVWLATALGAVAQVCCGAESAFAQGDAAAHLLFFNGTDLWRNGLFSHAGVLWAYRGLHEDGPVFKVLLNTGFYRYDSGGTEVTGRELMAAILPGWHWHWPGLEVTVFAGLDVQDHRFAPVDADNRLHGTHAGARGGFEAWYEPLPNGMVTAAASLSTVGKSYWTRAAAGWRLFDVWLGPELHAVGDDTYHQFRVGAHVTSLRFWGREWSAGVGWVTDTDRRDGMYGRIGLLWRR
jgi:hypothetical protein